MANYVLVHGGFTGGWEWGKVAAGLRTKGHVVFHPSLDGCAERAHALRPGISLESHGREIAQLLYYEDLRDTILVGTSTSGMVVARAAEECPQRIARLVFIDALVPIPGETVAIINERPPHDPALLTFGRGAEKSFMDIEDPALRSWAQARYTPHPRAAAEDPVDLKKFWSMNWQADVLRCLRSRRPSAAHLRRTAERLRAGYSEIDSGHYPMLTHVQEIVRYLEGRA